MITFNISFKRKEKQFFLQSNATMFCKIEAIILLLNEFNRVVWEILSMFFFIFLSSIPKNKTWTFRFLNKNYINNYGWSHKFIALFVWGLKRVEEENMNKNRREPIKSSFRLPVLWNQFFISHFAATLKTPQRNDT